jgi:hypothetical protein
VGGILGRLMEPLYFVTAREYYKGKMRYEHIKQLNIYNRHSPPSELRSPVPPSGSKGLQQQYVVDKRKIVGGVKFLHCLSVNRVAATGFFEMENWAVQLEGTVRGRKNYKRSDSMTVSIKQVRGEGGR